MLPIITRKTPGIISASILSGSYVTPNPGSRSTADIPLRSPYRSPKPYIQPPSPAITPLNASTTPINSNSPPTRPSVSSSAP